MEIIVDLKGCKDEKSVLLKLGETFGWVGWGENWDALNDSLHYLEGGAVGATKNFELPLKVSIQNYQDFKNVQPEKFQILKEVFESNAEEYKKEGKSFEIAF